MIKLIPPGENLPGSTVVFIWRHAVFFNIKPKLYLLCQHLPTEVGEESASVVLKLLLEKITTLRTSEMQQSKDMLKAAPKLLVITNLSLSSILQLMPNTRITKFYHDKIMKIQSSCMLFSTVKCTAKYLVFSLSIAHLFIQKEL